MAENTETSKTYEGIGLRLVEDWDGEEVVRAFRVKGTDYKYEVRLPIPESDEEAEKFYACTLHDLLKKGVIQRSYDADTPCRNLAVERVEKGEEPGEFANAWLAELQEALSIPKARRAGGSKKESVKVGKTATTLNTSQGLTSEQIMEVMTYADENNVTLKQAREALGY